MKHSHLHKTGLINFPVLLKVVGWLLIIESAFLLVPFATSCIYGEKDSMIFLISAVTTAVTGILLNHCIHPRTKTLRKRESILLTSLTWIVFSIFGMIPFIFGSTHMSVSDAFLRRCRASPQPESLSLPIRHHYPMANSSGEASCNGSEVSASFCSPLP